MTGVAALALSAAFTSCSKNEELYNQGTIDQMNAEKITQSYNDAFIKYVGGPIASNQDWGFGSNAGTRAGGDWANYSGAQTDGHLWTSFGFKAPDALTDGQKLRVQYYFQMNKITNPNQPDNGVQDFFMQQVYDGATDPITKYKEGDYSTEVYKDAVGHDVNSGNLMNWLKAGSDHAHVNNFNNSNYPDPIPNVANWDQTVKDDPSQEHVDQIMLMLNTKTDCFGYANSNNSVFYDDQWTLVAGSVIDNYCENVDAAGYAAFLAAHSGVTDKKVVDTWNRSFIGFDFKSLPDPSIYLKKTAKYSDENEGTQWKLVFNGSEFVEYDPSAEILVNDAAIPVLNAETNFMGGEVIGVGGQDNRNDYPTSLAYDPNGANDGSLYLESIPGHQSDHKALNLNFIKKMVRDGYSPVDTKHLKLWVKVSDMTDGYYSDWIVSFMPATYTTPPTPPTPPTERVYTLRVLGEDLTFGEDADADFDFNDVVFDVCIDTEKRETWIKLQAAGGTLPLYIDTKEVHALFDQTSTDVMINTGKGPNHDPVEVKLDNYYSNAKNIPVTVTKNGVSVPLKAERGEPASKIAVNNMNFQWCGERVSMKQKYPLFTQWCTDNSFTSVWWE